MPGRVWAACTDPVWAPAPTEWQAAARWLLPAETPHRPRAAAGHRGALAAAASFLGGGPAALRANVHSHDDGGEADGEAAQATHGDAEATKGEKGEAHPADTIQEANRLANDSFLKIQADAADVPRRRKALEAAMARHAEALRPLCQEYMRRQAELKTLAGPQCDAAQGRVNAAILGEGRGPKGCCEPRQGPAGRGAVPSEDHWIGAGPPLDKLPEAPCTGEARTLPCTARIAQLAHPTAPPPGGKAGEEQIDAQVRRICHPNFSQEAQPISERLAHGLGEDEADVVKPVDDEGAANPAATEAQLGGPSAPQQQ